MFKDGKVEVWVGTQNGETSIAAASEASGVPLESAYVHKMHAGGGFGRRGPHQEYTTQAVKIAQSMPGTPVSLQWSREEDIQQGRYRPVALVKLRGGLDAQGNWVAWHVRQADQSILITVRPTDIKNGIDPVNVRCFQDNPYAVPNFTNEYAMRNTHVPPGFWRAVAHTNNPFFPRMLHRRARARRRQGSVSVPASAAAAEAEGSRRAGRGGEGGRVGHARAQGRAPRHRGGRFLRELHRRGGGDLGQGRHTRSTSSAWSSRSTPGYVVHRDAVKAQIEGGVLWGLGSAMHEEITLKDGRVMQNNFSDYPLLRLAEAPGKIECIIMPTGGFWGGVGEPPIGGVVPGSMQCDLRGDG